MWYLFHVLTRSRLRKILIIAVPLGVLLLVLLKPHPSGDTAVDYHLRRMKDAHLALGLRGNVRGAFRINHLKYALGFKNPAADVIAHQNRFLELGYFASRNFSFSSTNALRDFVVAVRGAEFGDTNWSYGIDGTNVLVTAAASDLPEWARIASNVNARVSDILE